jgi:predicted deacylase
MREGTKRRGSRSCADGSVTLGIGPGFADGGNVDVALESPAERPWESDGRNVGRGGAVEGNGRVADGCDASCAVEATRHGRFITERRIGDAVEVGQIVGGLGNEVVKAPASGVLLGLAARGARIEPGDTLVEVDCAGVAHRCHGLGAGPRGVAERVLSTLSDRREAPATGTNGR